MSRVRTNRLMIAATIGGPAASPAAGTNVAWDSIGGPAASPAAGTMQRGMQLNGHRGRCPSNSFHVIFVPVAGDDRAYA